MLTGETIQLLEAIDHLVDVRVAVATKTPRGLDCKGDEERIREARARLQVALTRVTDKIPWSGR
jgi:hypothetical protein